MLTLIVTVMTSVFAMASTLVRVERRGPAELSAQAGSAVSAAFIIHNEGAERRLFVSRLELPGGWHSLDEELELNIDGHAAETRVVTVLVPRNAHAGWYVVRFTAEADGEGSSDSVRIRVSARTQAELTLDAAPAILVNGSEWSGAFTVRNAGNAPADFRVLLDTVGAVSVMPRSVQLQLGIGEVRAVNYRIIARGDLDRKVRGRVFARVTSDGDTAALDTAQTVVDVVPQARRVAPLLYSVPSHLLLRTEPFRNSVWAELTGRGSLKDGGSTAVNFLLRGPSFEPSLFGDRPEYWLELTGKNFRARAGDQMVTLSPLTHDAQYGSGLTGTAKIGDFTTSAFTTRNRFAQDLSASGVSVALRLANQRQISVNAIADDSRNGSAASIRAQIPLRGTAAADVEIGRNAGGTSSGGAYALRVGGEGHGFTYNADITSRDVTYAGALPGLRQQNVAATYHAPGDFNLRIGMRNTAQDALAQEGVDAWRHRDHQYYGQVDWRNRFWLELATQRWADESGTYRTDRTAHSAKVRTRAMLGGISLVPLLEAGAVRDQLSGTSNGYARGELGWGFAPNARLQLGGAVRYQQGAALFGSHANAAFGLTVDGSAALTQTTNVTLGVQLQHEQSVVNTQVMLSRLRIDQRVFGEHRVGVQAQITTLSGDLLSNQSNFALDYQIPIGIPTGRQRSSGHITGILIDAATRTPVPNIVLTLGDRSVATDSRGRFAFANVMPGEQYLQMDVVSVPAGFMIDMPQPFAMHVKAGSTASVQLELVRAARVSGSAFLSDSTQLRRLEGAVFELRRADEVHRRVSSADGTFSFDGVRPGKWELRVVDAPLPPHHAFMQENMVLDVAPGGVNTVQFVARPVKRAIKMQDEQRLTLH